MTRHNSEDGELDIAARLDTHGLTAAARAVMTSASAPGSTRQWPAPGARTCI
ncbi:hypothetical protein AB0D74_48075 [Streptomyces sp. NPDC048278]|uniref:hypothetical protein n=1 Tax=Streptomyces sp. NPDC048278 TaxID=3155809 RepID=UPI00341D841D